MADQMYNSSSNNAYGYDDATSYNHLHNISAYGELENFLYYGERSGNYYLNYHLPYWVEDTTAANNVATIDARENTTTAAVFERTSAVSPQENDTTTAATADDNNNDKNSSNKNNIENNQTSPTSTCMPPFVRESMYLSPYKPGSLIIHNLPQQHYQQQQSAVGSLGHHYNIPRNPGPPIKTTHNCVKGPKGANLFVFHIPNYTTNMELYQTFLQYGNVLSVKIIIEWETGCSRGFGFVSYDSPQAAALAIEALDGIEVGNKRLKVQYKNENHSRGKQEREKKASLCTTKQKQFEKDISSSDSVHTGTDTTDTTGTLSDEASLSVQNDNDNDGTLVEHNDCDIEISEDEQSDEKK